MARTSEAVEALRAVDLFSRLSDRSLDKVARRVKSVAHPAGKDIALDGQEGTAFHLVRSGSADVLVGGSVVRTLGPGDWFGDLSLIDRKPRSATVRTTSPTETWVLVAWEFTPLLDDEPEITKALLLVMCERLRSAEAR
jgi:CRP/FNR family transcriptional regulator, cyclic AMP receptor protein